MKVPSIIKKLDFAYAAKFTLGVGVGATVAQKVKDYAFEWADGTEKPAENFLNKYPILADIALIGVGVWAPGYFKDKSFKPVLDGVSGGMVAVGISSIIKEYTKETGEPYVNGVGRRFRKITLNGSGNNQTSVAGMNGVATDTTMVAGNGGLYA